MSESRSVVSNSLHPHGLYSLWNSPGFSLLQWIFPTWELNWSLPHCRLILYQLNHKGSPRLQVMKCPLTQLSSYESPCLQDKAQHFLTRLVKPFISLYQNIFPAFYNPDVFPKLCPFKHIIDWNSYPTSSGKALLTLFQSLLLNAPRQVVSSVNPLHYAFWCLDVATHTLYCKCLWYYSF